MSKTISVATMAKIPSLKTVKESIDYLLLKFSKQLEDTGLLIHTFNSKLACYCLEYMTRQSVYSFLTLFYIKSMMLHVHGI